MKAFQFPCRPLSIHVPTPRPAKRWAEMLLTEFRPARVHALVGGLPELHEGIACIRPDQWLEISGPDPQPDDPRGYVVTKRRFPAARVQMVEWLHDDPASPWEALRTPEFTRAALSVLLCGRYVRLQGRAAQRDEGWTDFLVDGPWRGASGGEPHPDVSWVSFPAHAVHRLDYLEPEAELWA